MCYTLGGVSTYSMYVSILAYGMYTWRLCIEHWPRCTHNYYGTEFKNLCLKGMLHGYR